ncbi:MAG: SpoIIE family protein phosphatase [Candidatus Eisenbacteria bacterium]|nr:SpoIIE family protein phosphatase [Candidatus Eisenbacteria bacterium]
MTDDRLMLVIRSAGTGPNRVRIEPGRAYTVGRTPENEIVLAHPAVSRRHARIECDETGCVVEDLGSTNGTRKEDRVLAGREALVPGERLEIGPFSVLLEWEETSGGVRVADLDSSTTMGSMPVASIIGSGEKTERSAAGAVRLLERLDRVGDALLAVHPMEDLLEKVVDLARELTRAERVALLLIDEEGTLVPRAFDQAGPGGDEEILVSRSIALSSMERREAVRITDAQSDSRFRAMESVANLRIHSAMCAPLWNGSEVTGILYADDRNASTIFSDEDLQLLTLIGHLAAVKIRETLAHEELERKRLLEEELKVAHSIQQKLLPEGVFERGEYRVAGRNVPSLQVGGDYFDYFDDDRGRLWVCIGDVSGKGIPAALLMSSAQAGFRAQVEAGLPLEEVVPRLNRTIHRDTGGERFITLVLLSLDPETHEIRYVNAGHNPPVLLRASGEHELLEAGGVFLGAFPDLSFETGEARLEPGDALFLYSDGVTEAWGENEEEFGEDRMMALLREGKMDDPCCFVERVIAAVRAFSSGRALSDDVTAVLLCRS